MFIHVRRHQTHRAHKYHVYIRCLCLISGQTRDVPIGPEDEEEEKETQQRAGEEARTAASIF